MEPLMNIIGDKQSAQRLRWVEMTHRSSVSETRVRARIGQLLDCTMDVFEREFNGWLQVTKMGNHCYMWTCYKLVRNGSEAQVWHTNVKGDMDRLVCTIHQDKEPEPLPITVRRMKGNDSESMSLDANHIRSVIGHGVENRTLITLHSGHRVEVRGSAAEIKQKIEDVKAAKAGEADLLTNNF